MSHHPIKDEKKQYSSAEWQNEVKNAIDEYINSFADKNDFHKQPHTFAEWMNSFGRYMSW